MAPLTFAPCQRPPARVPSFNATLLFLLAFCGHAAAALTGTFTVNSSWATGYSATMTVTNSGTADVSNWTGTLTPANGLTSWWGVTTTSAASPYTLAPASYNAHDPGRRADQFRLQRQLGHAPPHPR